MLSPQIRRLVKELWTLFWSSGLSNPLVAIEQITYLLFIRQLESLDALRVKQGKASIYEGAKGRAEFKDCRWSEIRREPTFRLLNDKVFPWLRSLERRVGASQEADTTLGRISGRLSDAYFILDVNKTEILERAVRLIDELFRSLDTRSVNSDIMGDLFEHLLEEVKESGKNGQFRTPRHVIRFMVQLLNPKFGKSVLDPACGSGGFLLNTLLQWRADHTDRLLLRLEWDGTPHNMRPRWPKGSKADFNRLFRGYDNDRTMVRIAWMNLILHDLESPEVHQLDSLSRRLSDNESGTYDYILANPPFTGVVDEYDLSENPRRFPREGRFKTPITTKSELLFVWLMLDLLTVGGRAAVIVPDGVLFGSTNAHRALRRRLLFENMLEAVISLPANMFQPYSGVKTSILLFQKLGEAPAVGRDPRTAEVWFYEISDEAFSLDQKRKALYGRDNDLWDALEKFAQWSSYLQGKAEGKSDRSLAAFRSAAVAKNYYQPDYWEERWRGVDDDVVRIFPEMKDKKGHTYPLHELWPDTFPFDPADHRGARQYDDILLGHVRPAFEETFRSLVHQTVLHAHATSRGKETETVIAAAEKNVKALASQLTKKTTADRLLDREFDQFGLNALKSLLSEMAICVRDWVAAVVIPVKRPKIAPQEPDVEQAAKNLTPQLREFAKLDGYNAWRRSLEVKRRAGKLVLADDQVSSQPTLSSWIVPVRQWTELASWGEDPETGQIITRPTHRRGAVDPEYLDWLRDTLEIFDGTDGTVKKEYLDRLDPDCLEALDFNLSAGRHKPFVLEGGQHRPPAELIGELQSLNAEIQQRLGRLLQLVQESA